MALDDLMGTLVGVRHAGAGDARLRVRVAHERPEGAGDSLLDRPVKPAAGGPVGVNDPLLSVRSAEGLIDADDVATKRLEVVL